MYSHIVCTRLLTSVKPDTPVRAFVFSSIIATRRSYCFARSFCAGAASAPEMWPGRKTRESGLHEARPIFEAI
jgi:hypothetical protein